MRRVLVLLSAYQGGKYIAEQLESLDRQKGVEVHLLVRDDGSPDWDAAGFIRALPLEHVVLEDVIRGENTGFALSFSLLVQAACERLEPFDYYAFCDQDDVWLEDKLSAAVTRIETEAGYPSVPPVLYCSNATLADAGLRPMRPYYPAPDSVKRDKATALIQAGCIGCTTVFNHAALKMYAGHMPTAPFYAHDFLMYQACMYLGKVIYDPESHILYRQHGANQIGSKDFKARMKKRLEFRKHAGTLQAQSRLFLDLYREDLSPEDVAVVSKVADYDRNLFSKWSLLADRSIRYRGLESNFFYFLKVLGGTL